MLVGCGSGEGGALGESLVETEYGPVQGFDNNEVISFRGIPFAAPPVGDLRWRPPQAPAAWDVPVDATQKSDPCPQDLLATFPLPDNIAELFAGFLPNEEDCLYLNVDRPARGSGHPVMVWIHGGGFTLGEGVQGDGGTAGDRIARHTDTVVVSMNYRLGQFGFLAHEALTAESEDGASGNYGLLDQTFALAWVKNNVAAFGGDPDNVTIFGESAGAFSVCGQLASPLAAGLFHKAIIQSGSCARPLATLEDAEAQGDAFASALGCDGAGDVLACMRAAEQDDVRDALPPAANFGLLPSEGDFGQWGPILDGYFVTEQPSQSTASGNYNQVPTIIGFTRDEGRLFTWLGDLGAEEPPLVDEDNYELAVARLVGEGLVDSTVQQARYQLSETNTPFDAFSAVLTDTIFRCPARIDVANFAAVTETYLYQFEYTGARFQAEAFVNLADALPIEIEIPTIEPPAGGLGAFHSADIASVFGYSPIFRVDPDSFATIVDPFEPGTPDDVLWEEMMGYWTRFAATGDPNGEGAEPWPLYTDEADQHLVLDTAIASGTGAAALDCAFWEANPGYLTDGFGSTSP